MTDKTIVLITGANTGLGYQIVRALYSSDKAYEILLGGRSIEKAQQAAKDVEAEISGSKSHIETVQIDIEDDQSIQNLREYIKSKFGRLDVLVNNAGTQIDQQLVAGNMNMREMWSKSWDVNVVSTNVMTHEFIPLLLESADPRLLFMASGTSSLANTETMALAIDSSPPKGWPKTSPGLPAYRSCKTGMNMMMREWYRNLKEDNIKVWATSPGLLATGLGGNAEVLKKMGAIDPSIGAHFIKDVVEGKRDADVGKVINKAGIQPW